MPEVSRRTALRLAAATVPALAGLTLPGMAGIAAAAPRPTGSAYVRYESLYKSGDTLQAVINKVTGNRILTLPEGTFTFKDFRQGYYDGIRIGTGGAAGCRGLAGSGRNTIIRGTANTASRNKGGSIAGNQLCISNKPNAVLSNFTLKGSPQNGLYYYGIMVASSPDAKLSNLYLRGGSRGYASSPPGETFGINVYRSDRTTITDCEVDGRDDAGNRVGASPIGWNSSRDAKVIRTYCHHGLAGMLTFWDTVNVYTEDYHCFSTSSGSGNRSGAGINHEQTSGTIKHVRPKLIINGKYATTADHTSSPGQHMMFANTRTDVSSIQILEPTWDKNAASSGMFCLFIPDAYSISGVKQKIRTTPKVVKNGVTLARSDHPKAGWGSKDPKKYFAWVH